MQAGNYPPSAASDISGSNSTHPASHTRWGTRDTVSFRPRCDVASQPAPVEKQAWKSVIQPTGIDTHHHYQRYDCCFGYAFRRRCRVAQCHRPASPALQPLLESATGMDPLFALTSVPEVGGRGSRSFRSPSGRLLRPSSPHTTAAHHWKPCDRGGTIPLRSVLQWADHRKLVWSRGISQQLHGRPPGAMPSPNRLGRIDILHTASHYDTQAVPS